MIHVEGKRMLDDLSGQIRKLSPQLYLQLTCQVDLLFDVIQRSILFYVQRFPKTLRKFSWEIDQKNTAKIDFEDAFEKVTPPLLQTRSLREPFLGVNEFDYSAMNDYFYSDEDAPTYLQDEYDLDVSAKGGLNIGKILWTDLKFKDSKMSIGVQTSDLLASGIRRSLRGQFTDNLQVSSLLGKLMVESFKGKCPINLISFVDANVNNTVTSDVINNFSHYSKPMLV